MVGQANSKTRQQVVWSFVRIHSLAIALSLFTALAVATQLWACVTYDDNAVFRYAPGKYVFVVFILPIVVLCALQALAIARAIPIARLQLVVGCAWVALIGVSVSIGGSALVHILRGNDLRVLYGDGLQFDKLVKKDFAIAISSIDKVRDYRREIANLDSQYDRYTAVEALDAQINDTKRWAKDAEEKVPPQNKLLAGKNTPVVYNAITEYYTVVVRKPNIDLPRRVLADLFDIAAIACVVILILGLCFLLSKHDDTGAPGRRRVSDNLTLASALFCMWFPLSVIHIRTLSIIDSAPDVMPPMPLLLGAVIMGTCCMSTYPSIKDVKWTEAAGITIGVLSAVVGLIGAEQVIEPVVVPHNGTQIVIVGALFLVGLTLFAWMIGRPTLKAAGTLEEGK